MTFSSQVKNELVKIEYEKNCCKRAFLYGMLIFGKSFSENKISMQTENRQVAEAYSASIKELCNVETQIKSSPSGKIITVNVEKKDCRKVLLYFGHELKATNLKVNYSNFSCEECFGAFFAGAFLVCGTVSSPKKDYHLEFTVAYFNLSRDLFTMLNESELHPKSAKRNGYNIIYFKESETIEDFLYIIGASGAMFDLMNEKIVKDFRNKANRQANCETANIERMVKAVSIQIQAIEKIKSTKGLSYLNDDLKAVAQLRLDNPDASLSELSKMSNPPLSKSGINHRLKRIVETAEGIKK